MQALIAQRKQGDFGEGMIPINYVFPKDCALEAARTQGAHAEVWRAKPDAEV